MIWYPTTIVELAYDVLRFPVGVDSTVGEDVGGEVGELDEAVDRRPHGVRLPGAGHAREREGPESYGLSTENFTFNAGCLC